MPSYRKQIFTDIAHKLHRILPTLSPPRDRHRGLHRIYTSHKYVFYLIYKNEKFLKFKTIFKDFVNKITKYKECKGESINVEVLNYLSMQQKEAVIIMAHGKEDIGVLFPKFVKKFCEKFDLIHEQEVKNRFVVNSLEQIEKETTYSFPYHPDFFKPFDEYLDEIRGGCL